MKEADVYVTSEKSVNAVVEDVEADKEEVEAKENSEAEEKTEKKTEKRFKFKRYKIQEVIKPNQVILVQVIKDEIGRASCRERV